RIDPGDTPGRGHDAEHAGVCRGQASRAATVRAEPDRHQACAHRGGRTRTRPTRDARRIPRVAGFDVPVVHAPRVAAGSLADIGARAHERVRAHDDGTRGAQPLDLYVIARCGWNVRQRCHVETGQPVDEDVAFHRHRNAVQRAETLTGRHGPLGAFGLGTRPGVVDVGEGLERAVVLLDPAEE